MKKSDLPKELMINGLHWQIKYQPSMPLGHYAAKERVITIDNTSDEARQAEILIHELFEICMGEACVTYIPYPDALDDKLFVMSHRQFCGISKVFFGILEQFMYWEKNE